MALGIPPLLAQGLQGTLQGMQPRTPEEALMAMQQEAMAQEQAAAARAQMAQQQATQAQGAYQQAAAAPPPELGLGAGIAPFLSSIASIISGRPEFQQSAEEQKKQDLLGLIQRRKDNLQALRDSYEQKAQQAEKAGDFESSIKARNSQIKLEKQFDLLTQRENLASKERQNAADNAATLERTRLQVGDDQRKASDTALKERRQAINTMTDNIRQDPDIKTFKTVRDNYRRIIEGGKAKSGPGDMSMIFSYMKILDPTSVVRESEYKNARDAIGKIPQLGNIPKRWTKGDQLTEEGRQGFLALARQLYAAKKTDRDNVVNQFKAQADEYGIPHKVLFPDEGVEPKVGNFRADALTAARTGDVAGLRALIQAHPELDNDPELMRLVTRRKQ